MSTQSLSVSLPSDVVYVSGTVNSVSCTWTREGDAWETVADRAADDIYHVSLTAINGLGTSATYELTLYYGLTNLITDRTQADVDRRAALAKKGWTAMTEAEREEWSVGMRGAYNATDLNRVGSAVSYVTNRLRACGCAVTTSPKVDWKRTDAVTPAGAEAYLADVATLRAALAVLPTTPDVPDDLDALTYQEANNIEQILLDVDALITNMAAAYYYSGELCSGEV